MDKRSPVLKRIMFVVMINKEKMVVIGLALLVEKVPLIAFFLKVLC